MSSIGCNFITGVEMKSDLKWQKEAKPFVFSQAVSHDVFGGWLLRRQFVNACEQGVKHCARNRQ